MRDAKGRILPQSHRRFALGLMSLFRGLPTGYLGALEQRLTDTEAALHDAITHLHRVKDTPNIRPVRLNSARQSKTTKGSRLAEWAKFPLNSPEEVQRWWAGVGEPDEGSIVSGTFMMAKIQ